MHDIIAAQGIVLSKRTVGEANTLVSLLTEDLGVLRGSARSARLEHSKLRYGLEPLTFGKFSLVRGKHEWKITGTQDLSRPFLNAAVPQRKTAGRVGRLLLRLIQGEEPVEGLFGVVSEGLAHVARESNEEMLAHVEGVLVLRILARLGYVEGGSQISVLLETNTFSDAITAQAQQIRPLLIRTINRSLAETGL